MRGITGGGRRRRGDLRWCAGCRPGRYERSIGVGWTRSRRSCGRPGKGRRAPGTPRLAHGWAAGSGVALRSERKVQRRPRDAAQQDDLRAGGRGVGRRRTVDSGGTWAGAVEQLRRYPTPVYVRSTGAPTAGLDALRERGAMPWPESGQWRVASDARGRRAADGKRSNAAGPVPRLIDGD